MAGLQELVGCMNDHGDMPLYVADYPRRPSYEPIRQVIVSLFMRHGLEAVCLSAVLRSSRQNRQASSFRTRKKSRHH